MPIRLETQNATTMTMLMHLPKDGDQQPSQPVQPARSNFEINEVLWDTLIETNKA